MGYCFLLLFAAAAGLVSHGNDCSCSDGAGQLFWGIINLSFSCFLVAIKFLSHFISKCQCKYAVRFEMKSREEI